MKMQLLRWNDVKLIQGTRHHTSVFHREKGLDVAGNLPLSGGRRSIFLTSPFIDQAITLVDIEP
jgi:hypothetical protein